MTKTVRFYFDYISSNAYLAWIRLPELAAKYGYTVEPVPVLFAGLLEAHNRIGISLCQRKSFSDMFYLCHALS